MFAFNKSHKLQPVSHPPLPIKTKGSDNRFSFTLPEREYLLMDVAKRYYTTLKVNEIKECKLVRSEHRACKQKNPVQIAQLHEECENEMLQSIRTIPPSCSQRTAETNQTIWTQIIKNGYLSPRDQTYLLYHASNKSLHTQRL